jgi:hypothetical protein
MEGRDNITIANRNQEWKNAAILESQSESERMWRRRRWMDTMYNAGFRIRIMSENNGQWTMPSTTSESQMHYS